ncbi:hypothetical protein Tco_0044611 [Tanacetum coccineum]
MIENILFSSVSETFAEFQRISLTGFHSCTSCSHYQSVLKQTTRKRIFKKMSKKKAKNKQIQAREGKDQVKSKSKVIRMKKIQLWGAKTAKTSSCIAKEKDKG